MSPMRDAVVAARLVCGGTASLTEEGGFFAQSAKIAANSGELEMRQADISVECVMNCVPRSDEGEELRCDPGPSSLRRGCVG